VSQKPQANSVQSNAGRYYKFRRYYIFAVNALGLTSAVD
jgi:hypothetical protein